MKRAAVGALTLVLLALLAWMIFAGAGDIRTKVVLGLGSVLGATYTVFGKIPDWIVDSSAGSITEDDDPSNISVRIYGPILIGAIVLAVIAFVVVVCFM